MIFKVIEHLFEDAIEFIPELLIEGKRLGAHFAWDHRNANYLVKNHLQEITAPSVPITKVWQRTIPAFNQGSLGSCTGNGTEGALATSPFFASADTYDEQNAVQIYSLATTLDGLGEPPYPSNDRGSTVLGACKAAVQLGLATKYLWATSLEDCQLTLSYVGPLIVAVNWYTSMDNPDSNGLVTIAPGATIRGGHCIEMLGVNMENQQFQLMNSWGPGWGANGSFYISFTDFQTLLDQGATAATLVTSHKFSQNISIGLSTQAKTENSL